MTKREFLDELRRALSGLPEDDVSERVTFYGEMIDDRIEDGIPEETAVAQIGDVYAIASQIVEETPLAKLVKEKIRPKRKMKAWEIVLLALGSPLWVALIAAAFAVTLSLFAVLIAGLIVLWAVFGALCGCALGGILGGIVFIVRGNVLPGVAALGAGVALAGLTVLAFFFCRAATGEIIFLIKGSVILIKNCFIKKEEE